MRNHEKSWYILVGSEKHQRSKLPRILRYQEVARNVTAINANGTVEMGRWIRWRMEEPGRRYLQDVKVEDGYLSGYIDDLRQKDNLLNDIENTSGGFIHRYAKIKQKSEEAEGKSYERISCIDLSV